METLEYTGFRSDLAQLTRPQPMAPGEAGAALVYVGLSSFNVPDRITFSPLPPQGPRGRSAR